MASMAREFTRIVCKSRANLGVECPFCGEREGIDDNGAEGSLRTYGCHGGNGCGAQWDAVDYRLTEDESESLYA